MGSLGSLSWAANVMPALCCGWSLARGFFWSLVYSSVAFFAPSWERPESLANWEFPGSANDSFKDFGIVKVRTAVWKDGILVSFVVYA